jgi:hypothetical protein
MKKKVSSKKRSSKKTVKPTDPQDKSLREHLLYLLRDGGGAHASFDATMGNWPVQLAGVKVANRRMFRRRFPQDIGPRPRRRRVRKHGRRAWQLSRKICDPSSNWSPARKLIYSQSCPGETDRLSCEKPCWWPTTTRITWASW